MISNKQKEKEIEKELNAPKLKLWSGYSWYCGGCGHAVSEHRTLIRDPFLAICHDKGTFYSCKEFLATPIFEEEEAD